MDCIRSLLKTWSSWGLIIGFIFCFYDFADAAFASKFSLTVGELYSDNIFFSNENKDHDFVTTITPKLSLFYAPYGETVPTLNVNISPTQEIYARNSKLNNFDGWNVDGGYTYRYSPRLNFYVSDNFARQTQLGPLRQGIFDLPAPPTSPPPPGGTIPGTGNESLVNYQTGGDKIWNNFALQGGFLYRPDMQFTARYYNNFTKFIDQGGTDVYHNIDFRGTYNWRQEHNLYAGFSIGIYNSRNSGNNVVYNFNFGDDYFSNFEIRLSPTLTLSANTGLSLNTGGDGPTVANNSSVTITKIWETATLSGGAKKGLTSSYGIAGLSDTTTVFGRFDMSLSEKLALKSSIDFSLYDTDNGTVKTFQTALGASYLITSWLDSNLYYAYRWSDSGSGVASASDGLLNKGIVRSNNVYLTLTVHFDLWPTTGLSRSLTSPALAPIVRTPFSQAKPASPTANP